MKAATEKEFKLSKNSAFNEKLQHQMDEAMREQDRVLRWKKVAKLLRKVNAEARKEQDIVAADCKAVREAKVVKKTPTKTLGLRWGVSIPPMTWNTLVAADNVAVGHSDLQHPDKEGYDVGLKGSNEIVKDLEKAFPQFKVS